MNRLTETDLELIAAQARQGVPLSVAAILLALAATALFAIGAFL